MKKSTRRKFITSLGMLLAPAGLVSAGYLKKPTGGVRDIKQQQKANPETGWNKLTRREKTVFKAMYNLAKLHYPSLTLAQYKAQLKQIWDSV